MILTNIISYGILVYMITIENIYGATTTEIYTSTEIQTTTMTVETTTKSLAMTESLISTTKTDAETTTEQSTVTVVDAVTASNNNSSESAMESGCEELAIGFYNPFICGVMSVFLTSYLL